MATPKLGVGDLGASLLGISKSKEMGNEMKDKRLREKVEKIYYVHGWASNPSDPVWVSWLRKECEKRKIEFVGLKMPNPGKPKINEWVTFLDKNIKDINENCFLFGHSIGCQAILRYMEKLPKNTKVGKCIFVAGWFNLLENTYEDENDKRIGKPWMEIPIDFEKIKKHTNKFLAIFSDDDDCVPLSDADIFKEKLNAKIIVKNNEGHFDDTKEIKEIIEFIK